MSRLTWTQRNHGWHAGRYQIELAAPGLWVCSRKGTRPADTPTIEMTSGSLSALKERIERLETRRRLAVSSLRYATASLVTVLVVALASIWAHDAAPAVVVVSSLAGVYFALKAIDGVINRAWESLSLNYQ